MIELKGFSKSYSGKKDFAVKDVSIKIEKGTIAALLGVNGSGKSTIIKAITGQHFPTEGSIQFSYDGKTYNVEEDPENIMKATGYVPELTMLPQEMYVIDFLNYCAELHSLKNKEEAVKKVIESCSLKKVLSQKIKALSKGYKQRVSFAQAIIHNPENLVLDEPISGLDPAQIIQLRELITKLSSNKAIFISTHILQEVTSICNYVYIINSGKIVAAGTPEEIIRTEKTASLEEAFLKLSGEENE